MSLKIELVQLATAPGANLSALCRRYRIRRQTPLRPGLVACIIAQLIGNSHAWPKAKPYDN